MTNASLLVNLPRTKTKLLSHVVTRRPREVTQAGLINELLPDGEVTLTDLRITRAWCMGRNTERIVDQIAVGMTDSAERLAVAMCGTRRSMVPKLYRDDDADDE
jgi:hypothetical protein